LRLVTGEFNDSFPPIMDGVARSMGLVTLLPLPLPITRTMRNSQFYVITLFPYRPAILIGVVLPALTELFLNGFVKYLLI